MLETFSSLHIDYNKTTWYQWGGGEGTLGFILSGSGNGGDKWIENPEGKQIQQEENENQALKRTDREKWAVYILHLVPLKMHIAWGAEKNNWKVSVRDWDFLPIPQNTQLIREPFCPPLCRGENLSLPD